MPSMEALICGDKHLDCLDNIFHDHTNPNTLIEEAWEQPLNYARQNGVQHIIILGDIFDSSNPSQRSQAHLFQWLLKNHDLQFHMIPGNHDCDTDDETGRIGRFSLETASALYALRLMPNVHVYTVRTETEIDGVPFVFMPWPHASRPKTKYATVNIAHVPRVGAKSDSGRVFKDGEAVDIKPSKDYWYIGDLHQKQKLERCWYPGMLYQKTFGERLPKGFLHVEIQAVRSKIITKNKYVPIDPVWHLMKARVETLNDLSSLEAYSLDVRPIPRYSLVLGKDVKLPASFLEKNPHVVKWDKQSRLRVIEENDDTLDVSEIKEMDLDELVYGSLAPFLKKEGLNKRQVRRGREIIGAIMRKQEQRQEA